MLYVKTAEIFRSKKRNEFKMNTLVYISEILKNQIRKFSMTVSAARMSETDTFKIDV